MTKSSRSLTTLAAGVLKRFAAVEADANRIHEEQGGRQIARAVMTDEGLHILMQDQHGTSLEIAGGKLAVGVKTKTEEVNHG